MLESCSLKFPLQLSNTGETVERREKLNNNKNDNTKQSATVFTVTNVDNCLDNINVVNIALRESQPI